MSDKPPVAASSKSRSITPHVGTPILEDVGQLVRIATHAVDSWYMGPNGPYGRPVKTTAEVNRMIVREALLHLLELGLIDIDRERLAAGAEVGHPAGRHREGKRMSRYEQRVLDAIACLADGLTDSLSDGEWRTAVAIRDLARGVTTVDAVVEVLGEEWGDL